MEFIGRTVTKDFKGFGAFVGVVNSYNSSTGFFHIVYEDGDSEELEMPELVSLFNHQQQDAAASGVEKLVGKDHQSDELATNKKPPSKVGRKPKRRRRSSSSAALDRIAASGNDSALLIAENINSCDGLPDKTLKVENLGDFHNGEGDAVVAKKSRIVDLPANCDANLSDGLDLNCGLDMNEDQDAGELNASEDLRENDHIDLNLDLNIEENWDSVQEGSGNGTIVKNEYCFDLNLGVDEESKNLDADFDGQPKDSTPSQMSEETHVGEIHGKLEGTRVEDGSSENFVVCAISSGNMKSDDSDGVLDADLVNSRTSSDTQKKDLSISGTMPASDIQVSTGKLQNEKKVRKRRKLTESGNSLTDAGLRRSTRRGKAAVSAQDHIFNAIESETVNGGLFSPAVSAVTEDQPTISGCEESKDQIILPPKLQLPPSSQLLNLDGMPVLELFSVYAFLRSFSTLLFLSPFKLEDFVASLRSRTPSLLIDYIHVSLLQTLRKHLEFLSDENSMSASNCLRDLNWDLLDLVTWPIFLAEYLLIHSSSIKPGFDRCLFKLFENDYHKQPESVKIDILRCLCDDVIEVETIKSELNRRVVLHEPSSNTDFERNTKFESSKKRKAVLDFSGSSCVPEEVVEETADWNNDECCLCKMDGNLICCDGCPAAFHARCVGVATNLLPEGDWYCPECVIDRDNPWMKVGKSIRGAELLGIDPCGRLYYGSCGYLLVEDLCESEPSCHYYHKRDLAVVIEALGSSGSQFFSVLSAITKFWDVCAKRCGVDPDNAAFSFESLMKWQQPATPMQAVPFASLETCANNEGNPKEKCMSSSYDGNERLQSITLQNFQTPEPNCSKRSEVISEKPVNVGDLILTSTNVDAEQAENVQVKKPDIASSKVSRRGNTSLHEPDNRYVNFYSFAQTAWSVAENLTRKSSDKITQKPAKSVEELVSTQLKAVSQAYAEFCWSNIQNLSADAKKEKCGWCIACKVPEYDGDCLFAMNNNAPALESFTSDELGLRAKKNRRGRLIDVMCHIICLEDRLHGLLCGPWLNAHFPKLWRKSFLKASDIVSVQKLLLLLESNIRPRAISADWLKHVDSVATVGSASHIVTNAVRVPSKHVIGRKRSRGPDLEPSSSSNAASGLGLLWWRGGRLSRHLFNWKVLPRSVTSKAARQGGRKKIDGVLYLENSEFAKRSKYAAWRASVETSVSAEQLAVRVRELDANIRWDAIENNYHLSSMDKEAQKSFRSFKKVIVRRKSVEGMAVKYLLDFGKRRFIPDIVAKHGTKLEDSASERKRYWLEESYVPLHLLKGFEEKRIARKSNVTCSAKSLVSERALKKPSKKDIFSYLFSKAERCENYQCGHCNKDVLIREAVSCQFCEGFFHKRHVKKSAGAISTECKYTCHKCQSGKHVKVNANKGKLQLQKVLTSSKVRRPGRPIGSKKTLKGKQPAQSKTNKKVPLVVPLRRSARTAKVVILPSRKTKGRKKGKNSKAVLLPSKKTEVIKKGKDSEVVLMPSKRTGGLKKGNESEAVLLPSKKTGGPKKGKQSKSKKVTTKIPECILLKKRTQVHHTYWLNGLQLSRKSNDDRVIRFQSKNYLAPFQQLPAIQPNCSLCLEPEFTSSLSYICCELCEDWYHGDAFGLNAEDTSNLIGFKCHKCRDRTPPVCPNFHSKRSSKGKSGDLENDLGSVAKGLSLPSEAIKNQTYHADESKNLTSAGVPILKELHSETSPSSIQKFTSDAMDAHPPFAFEQGTKSTHNLGEKDSPDTLMEPIENTLSILEHKADPAYSFNEIDSPDSLTELNDNTLSNLEQKRESTYKSNEKSLSDTLVDTNENDKDEHLTFVFEQGTESTHKFDTKDSSDSSMEPKNESTLLILEHKTEPAYTIDERDSSETLMEQDDDTLLNLEQKRESTYNSVENTSLGDNVHMSGTDLVSNNGFVNSTANLTSEVNNPLVDPSESPPQEAL